MVKLEGGFQTRPYGNDSKFPWSKKYIIKDVVYIDSTKIYTIIGVEA